MGRQGDKITKRLALRAKRRQRRRSRSGLGLLQFSLWDYLVGITLGTICVVGTYQFMYGDWRIAWADVPLSQSLLPVCLSVMLVCSLGLLFIIGRSRADVGFMMFGCVCCLALVAVSVLVMVPRGESLDEITVEEAGHRDFIKVLIISFLATAPPCSLLGWLAIRDDGAVRHIVSRRRAKSRRE